MTRKRCQHISHTLYNKNEFFFFACLCFSVSECQNVPRFKGAETFLLPSNAVLFSSFPSILYLSYALFIQISFQRHHWLTHPAEFFLWLLTDHLKIASHHLLLEQSPLSCGEPPSCRCSLRSHMCWVSMLQSDVKVNLKQEKETS